MVRGHTLEELSLNRTSLNACGVWQLYSDTTAYDDHCDIAARRCRNLVDHFLEGVNPEVTVLITQTSFLRIICGLEARSAAHSIIAYLGSLWVVSVIDHGIAYPQNIKGGRS